MADFVIFCSEFNMFQRFSNLSVEPNWPLAIGFCLFREKENFTKQPEAFINEEFKSQSSSVPQRRD